MAKSRLSMILPKVGDRLKRVMAENEVEDCVVTYVNSSHGWYEVVFPKYNLKECFKLPTFDHAILERNSPNNMPVICADTGLVYSSIYECSQDMNVSIRSIYRRLTGQFGHFEYTFTKAL